MKCIQYWPNKGSQVFGSVTVMLKDTEKYSDFSIRTLAIKQVFVYLGFQCLFIVFQFCIFFMYIYLIMQQQILYFYLLNPT